MLRSYLKIAFKVILRRKFFTFISLFGIALTLTVLMVATALLDHVFGPIAPETRLDRTLTVQHLSLRSDDWHWGGEPGYQFLDRYVRDLPGVERVSVFSLVSRTPVFRAGEKIELEVKRTDGEFWRILEFTFLEGGPFTGDDEANANHVAVINRTTRRKLFDGEPAVGRGLELDGRRFRVVGVVENVSTLRPLPRGDVWVPISTSKSSVYRNTFLGGFRAMILARDRRDLPAIQSEFASRLADVEIPEPYHTISAFAETSFEYFARDFFHDNEKEGRFAWRLKLIIVGLMFLFMVLPTVNLVNINVSRILERASEIGVRKAFGASSRTLVGQFVVENVLLTAIGGVLGFAISLFVLDLVSDSALIPYATFHLNLRIFAWAIAITLFFGVFSGVFPAWKMSRLHPVAALSGRSVLSARAAT